MIKNSPLSGIRVIDFTHVLAGPACAYYLGLLGADVIKLESVTRGDTMRHRGGTDAARATAGMSTAYLTQAGAKRSIAVDLASDKGKKIVKKLLASADVLVENHRPETLKNLGLDEAFLNATNPKLIHCAMTGYGRGGPMENCAAYDVNIQAASGIMFLTGKHGDGPVRTGAPIMDYSVALTAGFAVSTALYQREITGKGAFIDVSMLETAYSLMASTITDYMTTGTEPAQRGNAANSRSPGAGSFPCREGVISLGINEEPQLIKFLEVIGKADMLDDPKFADKATRKANQSALETVIASSLLTRSADEWEALAIHHAIPLAKVRTLAESLQMPQNAARNFLHYDEATGATVTTLPFRIDNAPSHAPASSPEQHASNTQDILIELGFDEASINEMRDAGVIK